MKQSIGLTTGVSVLQALDMVKTKLMALKNVNNTEQKTHGQFKWTPYSREALILSDITNIAVLIAIDSYIRSKHEAYAKSAETTFGLESYPVFTWQDCSYAQWKHDLKLRMSIINFENESVKLNKAKEKLESHLSEADKLAMLYAELGLEVENSTEDTTFDNE